MKSILPLPLRTALSLGLMAALVLPHGEARADLLHHWDLQESQWQGAEIKDLASGNLGKAASPPTFQDGALVFTDTCHVEAPSIGVDDLPSAALSVEAWVSLSKGQRWGNIIGYLQDNGDYERGWSLGYNDTAFTFWLSTGGRMISVTADQPFQLDRWTHVTATFDGQQIRLYLDGVLAGQKKAEGQIAYPKSARYTLGAYRDDNEFYPMHGKMLRAKVYDHALAESEIARDPAGLPRQFDFTLRPSARFLTPDRALITWATAGNNGENQVVEFGKTQGLGTVVESTIGENGECSAMLTGLDPRTVYLYRIRGIGKNDEPPIITAIQELNTALNFTPAELTPAAGTSPTADPVATLLEKAGLRKGYAIIPHSFDPELAVELARQSDFTVLGFDTDRAEVERLRRELYQDEVYGTRISVMENASLEGFPLTTGMADLIFCDDWPTHTPIAEMIRLLAPGRGVLCLKEGSLKTVKEIDQAGLRIVASDGWLMARLPPALDSGQWTHQYGDTGNTTTSGEALGGATEIDDLAVQWFGRPGADFGLDRQSRMPAPLAANGRLFHQGLNRLVALDAHNGAVLWGIEAPDLQRLNMPRDASNWCVDDDQLYVAVRDQAWVLDAESGDRRATLGVPDANFDGERDWGYIGRAGNRLLGSSTKPHSGYKSFWSKSAWFDGRGGSYGTAQVCSDSLFAYSVGEKPEPLWHYRDGTILNTTIAVRDGRVVFVESRNRELASTKTSQIADQALWSDQFLVALDLDSGRKLWERPIDTEDGTVTFYLQVAAEAILITASNTQYHLYTFAPQDGAPLWQRSNPWPNDHHSGHIQHPVILNGTIYLQPNGYDLASGDITTTKVGSRSGCHTYIGARDALIFRGEGRQVALWDREKETVTSWSRLRPSCWLSLIPANGMLLVPEGGGGCSCGGWMETSIGFAPVQK